MEFIDLKELLLLLCYPHTDEFSGLFGQDMEDTEYCVPS
jgi:hypothetical protein